jgi:hypothetical protein
VDMASKGHASSNGHNHIGDTHGQGRDPLLLPQLHRGKLEMA